MPATFGPEFVQQPLVGGNGGGAQFGPEFVQQQMLGTPADSESVKALRRGVNSLGTGTQAAVGQLIQPFNEPYGTGLIQDASQTNQRVAQNNPTRAPAWEDVHGFGGVPDYVIVVVAICLFFGYWIVSKVLSKPSKPKSTYKADPSKADGFRQNEPKADPKVEQNASSGREEKRGSDEIKSGKVPPWYEILGTSPSATHDEIRRAYRQRMSEYHPDKVAKLGKDLRELAERKSKEINTAYDFILRQRTG